MKIISHSVTETKKIGRIIAQALKAGDILCLFGEFGSGKTVFVKGIAKALGIKERQISSPSFVLIREYKVKIKRKEIPFYHFDFYRLKNLKEILDLGYEEYLYSEGISVIEWADRLDGYLPKDYLEVRLSIKNENKRIIELKPHGNNSKALLDRFSLTH